MSEPVFLKALCRHRATLALRWTCRFAGTGSAAREPELTLPVGLTTSVLDEIIAAFQGRRLPRVNGRGVTPGAVFARLAQFPDCVTLCVDFYQAGAQVIGSFIVENAGPRAAWGRSTRNRLLGELDAIVQLLMHREVERICRTLFNEVPPRATLNLMPAELRAHLASRAPRESWLLN